MTFTKVSFVQSEDLIILTFFVVGKLSYSYSFNLLKGYFPLNQRKYKGKNRAHINLLRETNVFKINAFHLLKQPSRPASVVEKTPQRMENKIIR